MIAGHFQGGSNTPMKAPERKQNGKEEIIKIIIKILSTTERPEFPD